MRHSGRGKRSGQGFTLVELLVVIAVISTLLTLLLPAVQNVREAARRMQCKNNLKQIGLAIHNYADLHDTLPPGWIGVDGDGAANAQAGQSGVGWAAMILPFMEQSNAWSQFDSNRSITHADNLGFLQLQMPSYMCPSDPQPDRFKIQHKVTGSFLAEFPIANYVGCFGPTELDGCNNACGQSPVQWDGMCRGEGPFYHNSHVRITDITDGLSNTFLVGERRTRPDLNWFTTWVGVAAEGEESFQRVLGSADHVPNDPHHHFDDFSSHHSGGAQFVMCDGSVRFVSENSDMAMYQGSATIFGGESSQDF